MITVKMLRDALATHPDDNEVLIVYEADDPDDSMTYQIAHIKGYKNDPEFPQTHITIMDY